MMIRSITATEGMTHTSRLLHGLHACCAALMSAADDFHKSRAVTSPCGSSDSSWAYVRLGPTIPVRLPIGCELQHQSIKASDSTAKYMYSKSFL